MNDESNNNNIILPIKKKTFEKIEIFYKLNWWNPRGGGPRTDLNKSVIYTMSSKWSDLLRVIPSNRWSSMEEIINFLWAWEKRQYRPLYPARSRNQIESGVLELVEAGIVLTKP